MAEKTPKPGAKPKSGNRPSKGRDGSSNNGGGSSRGESSDPRGQPEASKSEGHRRPRLQVGHSYSEEVKGKKVAPEVEDFDPEVVASVNKRLGLPENKEPVIMDHYFREKDRTTKFGQLTTWFSLGERGTYLGGGHFPAGWRPVYVHVLIRHGSRWPTKKAWDRIKTAVQKLKFAGQGKASKKGKGPEMKVQYKMLSQYKMEMTYEILVPHGHAELEHAGQTLHWAYQDLFDEFPPAFQRVDKTRMNESHKAFRKGYMSAFWNPPVALPWAEIARASPQTEEGEKSASAMVKKMVNAWRNVFLPPITNRLNEELHMPNDVNKRLTDDDTLSIMEIIAFEYAVEKKLPEWHEIFTDREW